MIEEAKENLLPWKNFKINKCSLIKDEYDLLDFQQYAIYLALNSKSFVCGLPTGSGKSCTSLATYFYYKEKYPKTKLLIFTDSSAILQFNSEISKFFKYEKERLVIYDNGTNYKKHRENSYNKFQNDESFEIMILNYPIAYLDFPKLMDTLINFKNKDSENKLYCIFDEATAFKNISTKTHKSISKIANLADKKIALTATITKGKAEEIYGIFKGIGILLEKTKAAFLEKYCILKKIPNFNFVQIVGYKNINELKERISKFSISVNKSDIQESLPSFTIKTINVKTDSAQTELIKKIKNGYFIKEDLDREDAMITALTEFGYIRRSLIDPNIVYSEEDLLLDYKSPKTIQLLNLLENEYDNEKLVIYCASKKYINILEKEIKNCSNKNYTKVLKITGDVSNEDRENYKRSFTNDSNYNIILINNAGIQAINLQISGTIICCNFPDNGGNLLQLMGRISRIDSKHNKLNIVYLITKDTSEEDEYYILNKQLLLLKSILGESEKGIIDYEVLKNDSQFKGISDEEFLNLSFDKIMYNKRNRK